MFSLFQSFSTSEPFPLFRMSPRLLGIAKGRRGGETKKTTKDTKVTAA
jgi:hypothetical protein